MIKITIQPTWTSACWPKQTSRLWETLYAISKIID